jgi:AraC-like DNA-binding protein
VDPLHIPLFHASTRNFVLGPYLLADSSASHPFYCRRGPDDVIRSGIDHFVFNLHLEGTSSGTCAGKPFHAGRGDVSCYTFGEPFDFTISPFRTIALMAPRAQLSEGFAARVLRGFIPSQQAPLARVLATALREIAGVLPSLSRVQGLAAARAIAALAEATFGAAAGAEPVATKVDLELYARAQSVIEEMLGDPGLSATGLARVLAVSRTALYEAFARAGGVQAYIRERRLQRFHDLVVHGLGSNKSIAEIAFGCGFRGEGHFSRAFKKRFGVTPGRLRQIAEERSVFVDPPRAGGIPGEPLRSLGRDWPAKS